MNREAWWATIQGVENELDTTELNSNNKVELTEAKSRISVARVWGWGRGEYKFQILRGRRFGGSNVQLGDHDDNAVLYT